MNLTVYVLPVYQVKPVSSSGSQTHPCI